MKKIRLLLVISVLISCQSCSENEDEKTTDITSETTKELEEVQETNVELETMDGELDSLINLIN